MPEDKSVLLRFVFSCLLTLAACFTVSAQSTIFNIPSTDVADKKSLYVEADFIAHFDKYENGGFQTYGFRTVYGVGRKLEIGANYFYTRYSRGTAGAKEFQPNIKYQIYGSEKKRIAVATGALLFVPLNEAAGRRTFGMVYANASKTFKRTGETRLTGGYYAVIGAERDSGTKQGAIFGVEQPITSKLRFTGDWFSGKNRFGYAAAGFDYTFDDHHYMQIGYNWGNSGRGNNAFTALYGYTF